MKMFKKTAAIAASLLAVTLVGGASLTNADAAASYTTDLCVIATSVDDPTIKAQHGNCGEEVTTAAFSTSVRVQLSDPAMDSVRRDSSVSDQYKVQLIEQSTGQVVSERVGTFDRTGYAFSDPLVDNRSSSIAPTYVLTVTYANHTYTHTPFTQKDFTAQNIDGATSYKLSGLSSLMSDGTFMDDLTWVEG